MKEHPILFSGEMVRAILDGRKTQTRRVLKKQPIDILPMKVPNMWVTLETRDPNHGRVIGCRYGLPGDHLWVRETWAHDDLNCKDVKCGNRDHIWWKANEETVVADSFAGTTRWRSPIYMPRWASRITLEIINVRAERLHNISHEDAKAEGLFIEHGSNSTYVDRFMLLWDAINAKRGYGWSKNPWVWCITFEMK